MTTVTELVLSDAELTLLAAILGRSYFPCALPPELDDAGWDAVARGLAARGVLRDEDPPAVAADAAAVLGVVLFADRSLWVRVMATTRSDDRVDILWVKGDTIVRQALDDTGVSQLRVCEPSVLAEVRAAVLDIETDGGPDGELSTLGEDEFVAALASFASDGVSAAAANHRSAAGFIEALADARRLACVEERLDVDGRRGRCELTLVESPAHGLWMARTESSGESTTLQRLSATSAREQMTALVGTAG